MEFFSCSQRIKAKLINLVAFLFILSWNDEKIRLICYINCLSIVCYFSFFNTLVPFFYCQAFSAHQMIREREKKRTSVEKWKIYPLWKKKRIQKLVLSSVIWFDRGKTLTFSQRWIPEDNLINWFLLLSILNTKQLFDLWTSWNLEQIV